MRPEIKRAQLFETADQECELGLKRGAGLSLIKRLQKRIVFGLDDALRGQTLSENPCQRALSNSYWTFDRDITGKLEKIGHELLVEN
jgi:hypothetical protein